MVQALVFKLDESSISIGWRERVGEGRGRVERRRKRRRRRVHLGPLPVQVKSPPIHFLFGNSAVALQLSSRSLIEMQICLLGVFGSRQREATPFESVSVSPFFSSSFAHKLKMYDLLAPQER